MSFIFGGNTGIASPQEAARLRARASGANQRMAGAMYRRPADLIDPAGNLVASLIDSYRAGSQERAGRKSADQSMRGILDALSGGKVAQDPQSDGGFTTPPGVTPITTDGWKGSTSGASASGAPGQGAQPGGDVMAALMGAMSNPWVAQSPGYGGVMNALMQQQLKTRDPLAQQELELRRRGLDLQGRKLDLQSQQLARGPQARPVKLGTTTDPATGQTLFYDPFTGQQVGDPLGGLRPIGSASAQTTEGERKAASRLSRAESALAEIDGLVGVFDPNDQGFTDWDGPGWIEGNVGDYFDTNTLRSDPYEAYLRAFDAAIEPLLRDDSGAALNAEDIASKRRQYQWTRTDTPAQRKRKLDALRRDIASLRITAGRAAPPPAAASAVSDEGLYD